MIPFNIAGHTGSKVIPPEPSSLGKYFNTGKNNIDTHIDFPQATQNDTWSISCRVFISDLNVAHGLIGDDGVNYYLRIDPTNNRLIARAGDGTQVFFTGFIFEVGTWYQVDMHSDNLTARAYVDNIESTAGALAINSTAGGINQWRELLSNKGANKLKGGCAWFGFWQGYVLSNSDRLALLEGTKSVDEVGVGNHYFAYGMNHEGTETTVVDLSIAGNDGTVVGSDYVDGYTSRWIDNDLSGKMLHFQNQRAWSSAVNGSAGAIDPNVWTMYFRTTFGSNGQILAAHPTSSRLNIVIASSTRIEVRTGSSGAQFFTVPAMVNDGSTLYEIIITCNALHETHLYLNGIEATDSPKTQGGSLNGWGSMWFGKGLASTTTSTTFALDRYLIWYDHVATQTEVTNIWNGGTPLDPSTIIGNPTIHYPLEPEYLSQRMMIDTSGNNYHCGIDEFWDWVEPIWVPLTQGESALVQDRMTAPRGAFIIALHEYVTREQGTVNDNWDLTDQLIFMDIDSEENALTEWKIDEYTKFGGNATIWTPYKGFNFYQDGAIVKSLLGTEDVSLIPELKMTIADAFIGYKLYEMQIGNGTTAYTYNLGAQGGTNYGERAWLYYNATTLGHKNARMFSETGNTVSQGPIDVRTRSIMTRREGTNTKSYQDGVLINDQTLPNDTGISLQTGPMCIGNYTSVSRNDWVAGGIYQHFIFGASVGLDVLANEASLARFHDRMLIQKHIVEVNTVLSRYIDLTDREAFAIGRLVARSVENGNWDLLDEFYLFGLYIEANALTGAKSKTAITVSSPIYTAGVGYTFDGIASQLDTQFSANTDSVKYLLEDAHVGLHLNKYTPEVAAIDILWGAIFVANNRLRLLNDSSNNRVRHPVNTSSDSRYNGAQLGDNMLVVSTHDGVDNSVLYIDGVNVSTLTVPTTAIAGGTIYLGGQNTGGSAAYTTSSWHIGAAIGMNQEAWNTDLKQAINELEIGVAENVDWDAASKTYNWSNRELLADQLQELVTKINANCDGTTTGRILNLVGHLGVTDTAQVQIDELITKGWTVTLI